MKILRARLEVDLRIQKSMKSEDFALECASPLFDKWLCCRTGVSSTVAHQSSLEFFAGQGVGRGLLDMIISPGSIFK